MFLNFFEPHIFRKISKKSKNVGCTGKSNENGITLYDKQRDRRSIPPALAITSFKFSANKVRNVISSPDYKMCRKSEYFTKESSNYTNNALSSHQSKHQMGTWRKMGRSNTCRQNYTYKLGFYSVIFRSLTDFF